MCLFKSSEFYIHGSVHRHSIFNKIQQDARNAGIYYCNFTLIVSGVYRTHRQENIKL